MKIDPGFPEEVVAGAMRQGCDQAEAFIRSSRNISIEVKDQEVDSFNSSKSFGYSLRVFRKGRLGFSYSTDPGEKNDVIERAVVSSLYPEEDTALVLPHFSGFSNVDVFDPELSGISEEDAIERVRLLEKSVYDEDERIRKVRKASGSFTVSSIRIVNSGSVRAEYSATRCSAQIMAIAEEKGESQTGWDYAGSRFLGDVPFEAVGRKAARRAVSLLGSRKIRGCKASVILDNSVTADFLGVFAGPLSSESVQKGKSLLAGKLGNRILSPRINIIDNGILHGGMGSRPVDDEGVATREKILVAEGTLMSFLYNTYTAKKEGMVSTGNAVRGSFSSLPSVGVTNLYMTSSSGEHKTGMKDIFGFVEKGLYVLDASGVHTANPISGEFSVGVSGIWVEKGEALFPVKEAVISGNLMDLFSRIEAVADDLKFYGNIGAPSLLISGIDISA